MPVWDAMLRRSAMLPRRNRHWAFRPKDDDAIGKAKRACYSANALSVAADSLLKDRPMRAYVDATGIVPVTYFGTPTTRTKPLRKRNRKPTRPDAAQTTIDEANAFALQQDMVRRRNMLAAAGVVNAWTGR
jgi:uncharacterized protein (DUF1684 family)